MGGYGNVTATREQPPDPDTIPPATVAPASRRNRIVARYRAWPVEQKILALLLLLFLAKGVVIALVFPPYSGHDEVMHYAYLRILAEEGRVPVIPDLTEWRSAYNTPGVTEPAFDHAPKELFKYAQKNGQPQMSFTTGDWFGAYPRPVWVIRLGTDAFPSGWVYTANHPPLFYLLMTPIYWLVQGMDIDRQISIFRMATIPFGMITVLFAYFTTRMIFPRDRFLAILVPAFVAFQPQVSYEASMLNNDILAIALTSIVFYLLALGLRHRFPWRICALTGLVFGLAVLAKNTSLVTGVVIGIAMILGIGVRNYRAWLPKGALTAIVTGLLIWPWYLYMYRTYGDFTAFGRIDELQHWNKAGRSVWGQLTDPDFAWLRWNETWGEFGWRLIRLDPSLLWLLLYACLLGVIGVAWWAMQAFLVSRGKAITFRGEHGHLALPAVVDLNSPRAPAPIDPIFRPDRATKQAVATLLLACLIAWYAILQFGTTFSLTQARYYFPTLPALAILLTLGYRALTPHPWRRYVETATLLGWFALNVAIYSIYVIPYWHPTL
jgi:4-amino-4-deoxy-L-arabinose transferase-like glycosyltransferase